MKMTVRILTLVLIALLISCGSPRKKGYDLQQEVWVDEGLGDSSKITKEIYLTGTKPIDSIDVDKLIYDIFRIETKYYSDSIHLYARVFDSLGNFVTNMADPYKLHPEENYFTALNERLGKHYKIRYEDIERFTVREYGAGDSIPYNLVLSVDYSGSMESVKEIIFEGTELFVSMKLPYDNIALTTFNKDFDVKVPLASDTGKILSLYRVKREEGFGLFSGVYDAVGNAINLFEPTEEGVPRVMVIFSDGDDNYSKTKIGSLIERAKEMDINIFTIAFGYSKDDNLRYLAEYTGGKFYKARTRQELISIFRDIYMSLRYYYLITYKPPEYWGWHHVTASLNVPGKSDTLFAEGDYDTSELFDWSDIGNAFKRPILFDFDSAAIKPESYQILDEITDKLISVPKVRLEIQGHTDNVGGIEYNQELSERRAKAVMDALIERGIEPRRLRSRGFGMSRPVASNDTEENRSKNRRTEFVVTAK